MKFSNRSILLISALVLALGLAFYFRALRLMPSSSLNLHARSNSAAHFYKDPKLSLSNIVLKVFYVVPKNLQDKADLNVQNVLKNTLEKVRRFHELQFRGISKLNYDIFPQPVILKEDNGFYDTANTNKGNPEGLLRISQEVYDRAFRKGGDLYDAKFTELASGEYSVLGLIYEGVGASGSAIYESDLNSTAEIAKQLGIPESEVRVVNIKGIGGFFIVNREFLTKPEYSLYGDTIFYHEFAHTFGLDDSFDQDTNQPTLMDVTGGGRNEPLELTYIDRSSLRDMGVFGN